LLLYTMDADSLAVNEADEQAYQELVEQLRETQQSMSRREASFEQERSELQAEIEHLKTSMRTLDASLITEQDRADRLERDLHHARSQTEHEVTARRIIEERNADLLLDIENQRQALATALADATDQTKVAELLRQELAQVRAEFGDVKALEERHALKVANLLQDQTITLRNLEEARSRGEDLESQIQSARTECEEVNRALKEASKEKDRLLRAQATEHDRIIRDHIAEADGDRAVLEHQFSELKAIHETTERQLKDVRAQMEVCNADAVGLREELQRVEHELREARHVERVLRDDLKTGRASQSDYEQRLENDSRLIAQILDVAIAFRNSHVKALNTAQALTSHPHSTSRSTNLIDSAFSSAMRHGMIDQPDEASPIDPSDPASALEVLRSFDHDHFLEALGKTGLTIRKWQKQCKEYRERAKGKISFRNFAKGDLALFLPTRNSVSKPWAAFNGMWRVFCEFFCTGHLIFHLVSFPHYFLQAMGHLAEQLKTREWIVARITSITERVVDQNVRPQNRVLDVNSGIDFTQDPSSNPYGLGDGVKYYMLEVEDWTQPTQPQKRRTATRKVISDKESKEPLPTPTTTLTAPPQAEVEDIFRLTRPPTSHLFPTRSRTNSSPTAGPSSLSRLLAQAPVETTLETIPPSSSASPSPSASPPPVTSPPPPPSPTRTGSAPQGHTPSVSSPLRPGSRASRGSSSSRFSVGRIPALGSASSVSSGAAKTAPTTALSDVHLSSLSSSTEVRPSSRPTPPSPDGSLSEGMSNVLLSRRRTTSYHIPRTSPLVTTSITTNAGPASAGVPLTASNTLASLASSWGVSFGRKKKAELSSLAAESASDASTTLAPSSAKDLLKRF
jgi:autophagy-related protein 11